MRWIFFGLICLCTRLAVASPSPYGSASRIVTAPDNPQVAAVLAGPHVWVTIDGGKQWFITGRLAPEDRTVANDEAEPSSPRLDSADGNDESILPPEPSVVPLLAVSNRGDVAIWHPSDKALRFCPIDSSCLTIDTETRVSSIIFDELQSLWVARKNTIQRLQKTRIVRIHPIRNTTQLLRHPLSGDILAVTPNAIHAFSVTDSAPRQLAILQNHATASVTADRILLLSSTDVSELSGAGAIRPICHPAPDATRLIRASTGSWMKRHGYWFYVPRLPDTASPCDTRTRQLMPGINDVTSDLNGDIWLATSHGPVKWHPPSPDSAARHFAGCGRPPELHRMSPAIPALNPEHPLQYLLPTLKLQGRFTKSRPQHAVLPESPRHQEASRQYSVGVFLEWRRESPSPSERSARETAADRNFEKQRQLQSAYHNARQRYDTFCLDAASSEDSLRMKLGELEMQKWQLWQRVILP
jgi:hypothetical protein